MGPEAASEDESAGAYAKKRSRKDRHATKASMIALPFETLVPSLLMSKAMQIGAGWMQRLGRRGGRDTVSRGGGREGT